MRKIGYEPSTKLIQVDVINPPADVARRLDITEDEQTLIRKRHMFADERPVQIASAYYPLPVAGEIELAYPDTGPIERLEATAAHSPIRYADSGLDNAVAANKRAAQPFWLRPKP